MKFQSTALGALILLLLVTCSCQTTTGASKSKSERTLVVLNPVAAMFDEDNLIVGRLQPRMYSKIDAVGQITTVSFVDGSNGWVSTSDSLYRTSDGGKTWEHLPIVLSKGSRISSFSFVDELRGWLAVHEHVDAERFFLGNSSRILFTQDGGKSWVEQASLLSEVELRCVRFLNVQDGLAIGHRMIDKREPYDEIFAVSTNDGGKHWNDISDKVKAAIQAESGFANDIGVDIDWSIPNRILLLTTRGRVITSADQGETWTTTVELEDERPNGILSSASYYNILLDTVGRIRVLAGARGEEGYWGDMIINDAPGLWMSYELIRVPILDAVFLSESEVLACGQLLQAYDKKTRSRRPPLGIILHSSDAGRSWSAIYHSNSNETYVSLSRAGEDDFCALSDEGNLLRFSFR